MMKLLIFCDADYDSIECNCDDCSNATICNHNCKKCLDDIHFHNNQLRSDYSCRKLLDYYVCRYSYKYCSEIRYALQEIDLDRYRDFSILSLGCGGAADLMAFDEVCSAKINEYYGIDINAYWDTIHEQIQRSSGYNVNFSTNIDVLSYLRTNNIMNYNVIIIEYLISFFYKEIGKMGISQFFDDIIESIVSNKRHDTPMLIIINDVDSRNTGRDTFGMLIDKLTNMEYNFTYSKKRFSPSSYYSDSEQYDTNENFYVIDYDFQQKYCVAKTCNSVQLIIEVE